MTEPKQTKLYLSGKEAAAYLGLHETTFYRRQEKHPLIPEVQIGDVKGYTLEDLREWDASIPKRGRPRRDPPSRTP